MPASTSRAPRASAAPRPQPLEVGPPAEPAGAPPLEPEPRSILRRPSAKAAESAKPRQEKAKSTSWPWLDVAVCAALALASAYAAATMEGSLRLLLGLSMLLFVPGYLLLQAFAVPVPSGKARLWQGLASIGISPAVVGVLALMTSIVEGGFKEGVIVTLVTVASLGFATAALVRRRALAHAGDAPATTAATAPAHHPGAPSAATAKTGVLRP